MLPLDVAKAETALDDCDIVLMQLETPMTTIEYVAAEAAKRGKRTGAQIRLPARAVAAIAQKSLPDYAE